MSREKLQIEPPPGTPLKCALLWGKPEVLSHSGIYLGNGQVAELTGDGDVVAVSLSKFLNGNIGEYEPALRGGFRIFAACDAKSGRPLGTAEVAKVARAMTVDSTVTVSIEYNLWYFNCHQFSAFCIEYPILHEIGGFSCLEGKWMINRLEGVIERILNRGREMKWLPVSSDTPGFRHEVPPGKYIQAAVEGVTGASGAAGVAYGGYRAVQALRNAMGDD